MRGERIATRVLAVAVVALGFVLTGCAAAQENDMNSDKAREQLEMAVDAVQSATGADWVSVTEVGPIGCSPGLEQLAATWQGTATVDRNAAYIAVREALEEVGFSTHMLAANSTTPSVGSQTGEGFGLAFSYPIEGGPLHLSVGSDCFPLEEWPDEG
jgi:hypothetical protein